MKTLGLPLSLNVSRPSSFNSWTWKTIMFILACFKLRYIKLRKSCKCKNSKFFHIFPIFQTDYMLLSIVAQLFK